MTNLDNLSKSNNIEDSEDSENSGPFEEEDESVNSSELKQNSSGEVRNDQHFLIDETLCRTIVQSLSNQKLVIEVGPGKGALTKYLVRNTEHLLLIEKDLALIELLYTRFLSKSNNPRIEQYPIEICEGNILDFKFNSVENLEKYSLISNLPYSISESFFYMVLQTNIPEIVLTTGRNFFDLLVNDSKLGTYREMFYDLEVISEIPKTAFSPEPRVESIAFKLTLKPFGLVGNIIRQHDKKLKNALLNALAPSKAVDPKALTKNEARTKIELLEIPEKLLEKRIMHLSNIQFVEVFSKLSTLEQK